MLSQKAKELFAALEMEYPAVAVKYSYVRPQTAPRAERPLSLCEYVKLAQTEGRPFYITKDDENCMGKTVLGMTPKPGLGASGQAGVDFEVFRTQAPNARLYSLIQTLTPGAVNYVLFSPVALCDFDPDLVVCTADNRQAEILMRATSYISGDLWESKSSSVMSCAWLYAYPYISGKVNFCITGLHHGMKRRGTYPPGLHLIAIPFQKLDEVVRALEEMPWTPIAMRGDDGSKAELARRMAAWQDMSPGFALKE